MITTAMPVIGRYYNWKNQPERMRYIGRSSYGNGFWHQFEKVDEPGKVWCELLTCDLHMLEETPVTGGTGTFTPEQIEEADRG